MPAPTSSDVRGNGSESRCAAIGATLKPPFPSKPGYALGHSHRMEKYCNLLKSCLSGRAEVLHSYNGSANAGGGRLPNRSINGLVSCWHP